MKDNLILLNNKSNVLNNLDIDKNLDFQEYRNREEFSNVVSKIVESGTSYVIKALPINDNIKDILIDVKSAFKTKDFKEVVKTAVNSTIREGLEILNLPKTIISDITKIGKIAFQGGLSSAISSGIDIISNKYFKNNIFSSVINEVLKDVKKYVYSMNFKDKVESGVSKVLDKTQDFNDKCDEWYKAYEEFDIDKMNKICKVVKRLEPHVVNDRDCYTQTNIIDNMTQLVNNKQSKLSPIQMQICNSI